jgi:ABC-type dipeptide/oligopeptide/nickel transport system permease component
MLEFIARRLLLAVPVLVGVSIMVFSIMHLLPGDPAQIMLAGSANVSANEIAQLRHELGLDQPLVVQYFSWIGNALHGDLGRSIQDRTPVASDIGQNAPATLELAVAAMLIAMVIGLVMGTLAAIYQHSWLDNLFMAMGTIGTSIPNFWTGVLLIFIFSLTLGWFPSIGTGGLDHLVLPAVALGIDFAAVNTRLVRAGLIDVLRLDYIRTARAKGLRQRAVVLKHALKNALIPILTIAGLQFGNLLGGAVVIETVFARQGLGRMVTAGILAKDYPVVQGVVLFIGVVYVVVNLGVDLTYGLLDPRIRHQ